MGETLRERSPSLSAVVFTFAFAVSVLVSLSYQTSPMGRILLPGLALSCFSLFVFFRKGGFIVTPSSGASYALFIFSGFPAIFVGLGLYDTGRSPTEFGLIYAVSLCYVLQLFIHIFGRSHSEQRPRKATVVPEIAKRGRTFWYLASGVSFIGALFASAEELESIAPGLGLGAVLFASVGAFAYKSVKAGLASYLFLFGILIAYVELIFDGFGRLTLAVLALCVGICASVAINKRWVKWAAVVATGPALVYMSLSRLSYLSETRGTQVNTQEGIGSVVGPLISSAHIVDAANAGVIAPAAGATVFAALVVWVPRSIWAGKPIGFGAEIVPITQPNLVGAIGHTDAALVTGEIVWNMGVEFAVFGLLIVALAVGLLDRLFCYYMASAEDFRTRLQFALVVLCSASLLNLVWGGTFTMASRSMLVLGFLSILLGFSFLRQPSPPTGVVSRSGPGLGEPA